jgi:hypothetical protein
MARAVPSRYILTFRKGSLTLDIVVNGRKDDSCGLIEQLKVPVFNGNAQPSRTGHSTQNPRCCF